MAGKGRTRAKRGTISGRKKGGRRPGSSARGGKAPAEIEARSPELGQLLQWLEQQAVDFSAHLREGERHMAEVEREIAELRKAVGRARAWKQVLERKQQEVAERLERGKLPSWEPEPGEDRFA